MDTKVIKKQLAYKILWATLPCFVFNFQIFSQEVEKSGAVINGKINSALSRNDSVTVEIYEQGGLSACKKFSVPIRKDKSFNIALNFPYQLAHLRLSIKGAPKIFLNRVVEQNDQFVIEVDGNNNDPVTRFSGKNVAKYACEDSLESRFQFLMSTRYDGQFKLNFDNACKDGDFRKIHTFYYSGYIQLLDIIDSFKDKISPAISNFYKATYTRFCLGTWEVHFKSVYLTTNRQKEKQMITRNYLMYKYPDYNLDQELASLNDEYLRYLIEKSQNELFYNSDGNGFHFQEIYDKLKNDYTGILRERLLFFFLTNPFSNRLLHVNDFQQHFLDLALSDASLLIDNPFLKQILATQSKFKKGTTVFNFTMPNIKGKMISLSNFKGKVVLLDVWGLGCTGCAAFFSRYKEEILPKLLDDTNFVKISISIDKTKDRWLRGINSGFYTKREHINLYTEGKELNHPFTKFYNLEAVPFLLLIDKHGKVYCRLNGGLSSDEIVKLIKSALKQDPQTTSNISTYLNDLCYFAPMDLND